MKPEIPVGPYKVLCPAKTAKSNTLSPRLLHWNEEEEALDAEYEPFRDQLSLAGLSEEELRKMDPDDRVAALEQANLDPYDFIYLAC